MCMCVYIVSRKHSQASQAHVNTIPVHMHTHMYLRSYIYTYITTVGTKRGRIPVRICGSKGGYARSPCGARSKSRVCASWHRACFCKHWLPCQPHCGSGSKPRDCSCSHCRCKHWLACQPRCGGCSKPRVYDA
jgi:hypothetical protein